MEVRYNVPGIKRKNLAKTIAEWLCLDAKYLGAPSFAYEIGVCRLDLNGNLAINAKSDNPIIEPLLEHLKGEGYERIDADPPEIADSKAKTESTNYTSDAVISVQGENAAITTAMPRDSFTDTALQNLKRLLTVKGNLIKKALAVDSLMIEISDEKISFPWFSGGQDRETVTAYTHFIRALCDMARNQRRITAKEKLICNEKYAFRCFLLRLGFIGPQYKSERKILLRNLKGSSSFKNIENKEEFPNEISK